MNDKLISTDDIRVISDAVIDLSSDDKSISDDMSEDYILLMGDFLKALRARRKEQMTDELTEGFTLVDDQEDEDEL